MKKTIGLVYGGKSPEHEVSLSTAYAVMNAIDFSFYNVVPIYITQEGNWQKGEVLQRPFTSKEQLVFRYKEETTSIASLFRDHTTPIDVFFPLLHGSNGEDGTVQGLFEVMDVPYVGNGVLASSAGMDKVVMKQLFDYVGLAQVPYMTFHREEWQKGGQQATLDDAEQLFEWPIFVKPANAGSSVGITKATDRPSLQRGIDEALRYDDKIVLEQGITAREIEMGVIGNYDTKCSVPGEIRPENVDFYDYEAKYADTSTQLIIPAEVTPDVRHKMTAMAVAAFRVLNCTGLVRADFFVTADNEVYINEVNTMPGFTPTSMFPQLWDKTGVSYAKLIHELIELAFERYEDKQKIQYTVK